MRSIIVRRQSIQSRYTSSMVATPRIRGAAPLLCAVWDPDEEVLAFNPGVPQHSSGLCSFSGRKRLLTVVTFECLTALGFDMEKGDVDLVDSASDIEMIPHFNRPAYDEGDTTSASSEEDMEEDSGYGTEEVESSDHA